MPSPIEDYIAYIRNALGRILSGEAPGVSVNRVETRQPQPRPAQRQPAQRQPQTPPSRRHPQPDRTRSVEPSRPQSPAPAQPSGTVPNLAPELATPQENLAHHPAIVEALRKELAKKHPQTYPELQKKLAKNRKLPTTTMADIHVILLSNPEVFVEVEGGRYANREEPAERPKPSTVKREVSASRREFLENEERRTKARQNAMRNLKGDRAVHQFRLLIDYHRNIMDELRGSPLRSLTPKLRAEIEAYWAERRDPAAAYPCGETVAFLRLYPPDNAPLPRFTSLDYDLEGEDKSVETCERALAMPEPVDRVPSSKATVATESNTAIIKTMREASALEIAMCGCEASTAFQRATRIDKIYLLLQAASEPIPFSDLAKASSHYNIPEKALRKMLNGAPELFVATPQDAWTTPYALALYVRRTGADLPVPGERNPEDDEVWGFDRWR